ncbi:interferon regulatory factor 9 [Elgaria multicarinata webbii]|uniref:interferon regulatory factor 9 n=1 Tax=Elgaria multicarinata webbii TaxID=159646 RepID=UPI002FCCC0DD
MATSRIRLRATRKLRQWTVEQVESGKFPGLVWDDPPANTMFRIPWKHAGKQEFRHEEDAAFFKAWAMFKGKYKPGEPLDPATWKTRIRCALSKSPEFEEMPHRSRLDIGEPYKVYRLVPPSEQCVSEGSLSKQWRSRQVKREQSSVKKKGHRNSSSVPQPPGSLSVLKREESSGSEALASYIPKAYEPSTYQTGESSPQPGETAPDVKESLLQLNPDPISAAAVETGDFSIRLSVFYSGKLIQTIWLPEGEFLITSVAAPPGAPTNSMTRVVLPLPATMEDPQKETLQRLLKGLEKGVMAASNQKGIFIQYRGKACISWWGPQVSQPHGKLEPDIYLQLFNTRTFQSGLEQSKLGCVPHPEHQVTLCVGEELGENESVDSKPIIIKMEQIFALRLLSPPPPPPPVVEAASCSDLVLTALWSADIVP